MHNKRTILAKTGIANFSSNLILTIKNIGMTPKDVRRNSTRLKFSSICMKFNHFNQVAVFQIV